ncbi:MAG: ABC transporter permease [Caulobacteraceae bacterium]
MIINRKIRRTMLESKSQYLGSIALIIISCLLYTMLNQLSSNMNTMTTSFEKDYVQEDASFVTSSELNNIYELESKFNARIEKGSTFDYAVSKDKTLRVFSENKKVNIPAITKGKGLRGNDILIDPAFAKANNLVIGSKLQVFDKSYNIVGFMALPNYIYPLKSENDIINDPRSFGLAVISKEDFNELNKGKSFYSIKFNSDKDNFGVQASQFRDYLRSKNVIISQWEDISDNNRVSYVNTKIEGIGKISSSMPVAILLLTCVLTGIVIWRLIKRESVIIGTLYAQGYRRKEIKRHYLMYPLSVALIGSVAGTILGALLLKPMLELMVGYFNIPITSVSFNPVHIVISLLMPVFFLGISGNLVLNRELRYSPVELMRGGREESKVSFIERKLTLDKLRFSTKFKVREQLRSLSRLVFLLLGVILATMLLLLGFAAKSSMDYLMKENLRGTFKFQYEYVYNSVHQEQPPSGTEVFSASTFALKSDSKADFKICAINPNSNYISLKDKSGADLNKGSVIITKPLAEKLQVSPGDTIKVINKLDSREYSVTVKYIAETYIGEYIFMPLSQFNDMLGLPAGSYIGLWSKDKLNIPENLLYSSESVDETIKAFNVSIQPLQTSIGIISLMSFIIGLIVIYVVTSLIIEENRGNISLMKVFGYRRKEVSSLILNSSSMVIVIGYIIGIPLILASMNEMFKSLTENINLALPVRISYPYIIVGFVVVYLTYELSKALSRKKINRISMSEALKTGME